MQTLLSAHGFGVQVIAGLMNRGGLATTREQVEAGGKVIEVGKVKIRGARRPHSRSTAWSAALSSPQVRASAGAAIRRGP
jgi:hypothetical protein